jgi:Glycosyl transferase family 90
MFKFTNIPNYQNSSNSILDDTRLFLHYVVGSYLEVEIKDNKPKWKMCLNEQMIENNALSDNIRCYTSYSVPTLSREHLIQKIFENVCQKYQCSDQNIFMALGDFPVIMKDRTKHPHYERYTGNYKGVYPTNLKTIFSRSIIPNDNDDILFPTRDFLEVVYSRDEIIKKINNDYKSKKSIAIFRGTWTGNDRTINNTRLQARIISLKFPFLLDVQITRTFEYYMYEQGIGCIHTKIKNKQIYDEDNYDTILMPEQAKNYKYILHIDGFVAAWRLALELFSMSVILKVDSPWIEHYYHLLIPYYHYIPIKADLSNLISVIIWCQNNDDLCEQIAKNAYNFAVKNFTKENLIDYLYDKCELKSGNDFNKNIVIDDNMIKISNDIKMSIQTSQYLIPNPKHNIQIGNIKYKHYYLSTKRNTLKTDAILTLLLDFDPINRIPFKVDGTPCDNNDEFNKLSVTISKNNYTKLNLPVALCDQMENHYDKTINNIKTKNKQVDIETLTTQIIHHPCMTDDSELLDIIKNLESFFNQHYNNSNLKIDSSKISLFSLIGNKISLFINTNDIMRIENGVKVIIFVNDLDLCYDEDIKHEKGNVILCRNTTKFDNIFDKESNIRKKIFVVYMPFIYENYTRLCDEILSRAKLVKKTDEIINTADKSLNILVKSQCDYFQFKKSLDLEINNSANKDRIEFSFHRYLALDSDIISNLKCSDPNIQLNYNINDCDYDSDTKVPVVKLMNSKLLLCVNIIDKSKLSDRSKTIVHITYDSYILESKLRRQLFYDDVNFSE